MQPSLSTTLTDLSQAQTLYRQGDLTGCLVALERHLTRAPASLDALNLRAMVKGQTGDLDGAIAGFSDLARRVPENPAVHLNLAVALKRARRWPEAATAAEQAVALAPDSKPALASLGACLLHLHRYDAALAVFEKMVALWPRDAEAQVDLGTALGAAGRSDEAVAAFEAALTLDPMHVTARVRLGEALRACGDLAGAERLLSRALALSPTDPLAASALAFCHLERGQPDAAARLFTQALGQDPDHAEARYGLAHVLAAAERHEEALPHLRAILDQDPNNDEARASLVYSLTRLCDWAGVAAQASALATLGTTGRPIAPFSLLALEDNPATLRLRTEAYARARFPSAQRQTYAPPAHRPARLRVGYFSCDFHSHATLFLMAGMFERLDRTRFEPILYSYGPNKADPMRQRLQATGLPIRDVATLSDIQLTEMARADHLDIAVDLKGHTQGNRLGPFASGIAPVQIHYLGYPGTLGCDFIDYLVVDPVIAPPAARNGLAEALITLPESYQVTDDTRPIARRKPTRRELGLPETGIVLASFNDPFKITAEMFALWMRVLRDHPTAVLWLYAPLSGAQDNLSREAGRHGVAPDRLVFADRRPQADHLARLSRADLFLDTYPCCAHTTASDALWGGLPMVTLAGDALHTRVAASLLTGVNMPDCVAHTTDTYEALIRRACTDPAWRTDLKTRLNRGRTTAALFGTARLTQHFEAGLDAAYTRFLTGQTPADIQIPPIGS